MSISTLPSGGGEAARDRRAIMTPAKTSPSVGEDARDRRQAVKTINTTLVKQGSRGPEVTKLQKELKAAGIDPGPVDGAFGPRTGQAVKQYQKQHKLAVDGEVGNQTWKALMTDRFEPGKATKTTPPSGSSKNPPPLTARFTGTQKSGQLNQMKTGRITVNGNTYDFRSGGSGRGNLPAGTYTVKGQSAPTSTMYVGKTGYSYNLSDKYDPRVGGTRSALRIHPDGGPVGTAGCIGIVGNEAVQKRFQRDIQEQMKKSGGSFQLTVG